MIVAEAIASRDSEGARRPWPTMLERNQSLVAEYWADYEGQPFGK